MNYSLHFTKIIDLLIHYLQHSGLKKNSGFKNLSVILYIAYFHIMYLQIPLFSHIFHIPDKDIKLPTYMHKSKLK